MSKSLTIRKMSFRGVQQKMQEKPYQNAAFYTKNHGIFPASSNLPFSKTLSTPMFFSPPSSAAINTTTIPAARSQFYQPQKKRCDVESLYFSRSFTVICWKSISIHSAMNEIDKCMSYLACVYVFLPLKIGRNRQISGNHFTKGKQIQHIIFETTKSHSFLVESLYMGLKFLIVKPPRKYECFSRKKKNSNWWHHISPLRFRSL